MLLAAFYVRRVCISGMNPSSLVFYSRNYINALEQIFRNVISNHVLGLMLKEMQFQWHATLFCMIYYCLLNHLCAYSNPGWCCLPKRLGHS